MKVFKAVIILFISFCHVQGEDGDYEYVYSDTDYSAKDGNTYNTEGEGYEYVYEYDKVEPEFMSEESHLLVDRGNTARLVCTVNNLGSMLISWKRMDKDGSPVFISMGDTLMLSDRKMTVSVTNISSILVIPLLQTTDTGVYICEVSSNPPVQQEHRVEIRSSARVEVQDLPEDGEVVLKDGDKLNLVCKGYGDPAPSLYWSRQNTLLPDGAPKIEGGRLSYSSVSGKHSGNYVCTGNNGFGQPSTVVVPVKVKYAPEILLHHEYKEEGTLELVCVVKGYPEVTVSWTRNDKKLDSRSEDLDQNGKHILRINRPTNYDFGIYTCTGTNTQGTVHAVLDVKGDSLFSASPEKNLGKEQELTDPASLFDDDIVENSATNLQFYMQTFLTVIFFLY